MSIGLNIIMYFTLHVTYYNAGIVFHLIRNKKVTENLSRYLHNSFYIPLTFALVDDIQYIVTVRSHPKPLSDPLMPDSIVSYIFLFLFYEL